MNSSSRRRSSHPAVTHSHCKDENNLSIHNSSDQTGFISGRHSANNTHRLINVTDYCFISKLGAMVVSLDAEKAFEQVNWEFSLESAQIWMVQSSYIESKCSVRINDLTSQTFNVGRATRRGCTLPSSLFGVCMEKRRC